MFASLLPARAETKVVAWNASPQLLESDTARAKDLAQLNAALSPDVLILIEVAGQAEAKALAAGLGWPEFHQAVSDWARINEKVHFAPETAIESKVPIQQVIEVDASKDGFLPVIDVSGSELAIPFSELEVDIQGIPGEGRLEWYDRVSVCVDLENGLPVFPVHMKSNHNSTCIAAEEVNINLKRVGLPELPEIEDMLKDGFPRATEPSYLRNNTRVAGDDQPAESEELTGPSRANH